MNLLKIKEIISSRDVTAIGKCSRFAVLVPLVEIDGEIHLLYELRSQNLNRQPGEISFPGGKIEKGETPEEAAIRETCEELCIEDKDIKLIGEFDTLHGNTNFVMYTFVGIISKEVYENLNPNKGEVEKVFLVSLDYLCENPPKLYDFEVISQPANDSIFENPSISEGYSWSRTVNPIPLYPWGETPIWGITAKITLELTKVLRGDKE